MGYLIAVEHDPKCIRELTEAWQEVAKQLGHELMICPNLAELRAEMQKSERQSLPAVLLLVSLEELKIDEKKSDVAAEVEKLKAEFKCDVMVSCFDDPLKPHKKSDLWPVNNIIYKPFDLTILKEHTRFALHHSKKIRTLYVHNAQIESEVEVIKKFQLLELSEFSFKVDKKYPLKPGQVCKFYHGLFSNKKSQHAWVRVVNETPEHYELLFCQSIAVVLGQIRKRVAASTQKVKNPHWAGRADVANQTLHITLQLNDEKTVQAAQELLSRNFQNLSFTLPAEIDNSKKIKTDVLLTDVEYTPSQLESQFESAPLVIRFFENPVTERQQIEKLLQSETLRFEKNFDRAHLVKAFKALFPQLVAAEEIQILSALMNEPISLSEVAKVQEFSEAAVLMTRSEHQPLNEMIELALPQEDESNIREIKAKVHYSSDKPADKGLFEQQLVLYGVRDEVLKQIRLWSLHQHIAKNNKGA